MKTKWLLTAFAGVALMIVLPELAYAVKITAPPYIENVNKDSLNDAGDTINGWILVAIGIAVTIAASVAGFKFIKGKSSEGWEQTQNVIIGAIVATVLASLVFTMIGRMG